MTFEVKGLRRMDRVQERFIFETERGPTILGSLAG